MLRGQPVLLVICSRLVQEQLAAKRDLKLESVVRFGKLGADAGIAVRAFEEPLYNEEADHGEATPPITRVLHYLN